MKRLSEIKAVSFDADRTLWDFEAVMRHSLRHALSELKRIDPEAAALLDVPKMIEIRERVSAELKGRVLDLEEVRLAAFRRTLEYINKPNEALAVHLNQVYLKHRYEDIVLFDDVLPTLEALRKKYPLGLISNGNTLPERCGLGGVFRFVVLAQDWGVEKPDPRIFQIAAEHAGCSVRDMLYVGDSIEDDVAGAANAGMQCVWLNRNGAEPDPGIRPDYEISSLVELLKLLDIEGSDQRAQRV